MTLSWSRPPPPLSLSRCPDRIGAATQAGPELDPTGVRRGKPAEDGVARRSDRAGMLQSRDWSSGAGDRDNLLHPGLEARAWTRTATEVPHDGDPRGSLGDATQVRRGAATGYGAPASSRRAEKADYSSKDYFDVWLPSWLPVPSCWPTRSRQAERQALGHLSPALLGRDGSAAGPERYPPSGQPVPDQQLLGRLLLRGPVTAIAYSSVTCW